MEFKLKEKHYKKGRFAEKEKLISDFKNKNITKDLTEINQLTEIFINSNFQVIKKNQLISLPEKNCITKIKTQSQINLFSLFLMFINKYTKIDFLSIETYTFNEETVFSLKQLLKDGKIKKLQIIMTETANFRLPKIYALLKELFANEPNCNLVFYWIHSKVNLINCNDEFFVLDGSGNFSMNAQIEHYNIFNSKNMFFNELNWGNEFYFSKKLRKNHEIFKNFEYGGD